MKRNDLIYRETARRIIDSPRNKDQMLAILNSIPAVELKQESENISGERRTGMRCPYRKIITHEPGTTYVPARDIEEFADCYEEECPYHQAESILSPVCRKAKNEFKETFTEPTDSFTFEEREVLKKFFTYATSKSGLFLGKYDAKNGNSAFMDGISTAFEFLAGIIDDDFLEGYTNTFYKNMEISERKAGVRDE